MIKLAFTAEAFKKFLEEIECGLIWRQDGEFMFYEIQFDGGYYSFNEGCPGTLYAIDGYTPIEENMTLEGFLIFMVQLRNKY